MRSNLFGRFAKLAVAFLAVGAMLTSCYDEATEKTYIPSLEDVKYVLAGTVTDSQTFAPIEGATVTCGSLSSTTGADGIYTLTSTNTAISGTVTYAASGYNSVTKTVNLTEASPVQTLNVALNAYTDQGGSDHDHNGDADHSGNADHDHNNGTSSNGQGVGGGSGE